MSEPSAFDPVAYIRALRRAGMYVEPFHEKRTFFVGNARRIRGFVASSAPPSTLIGQRRSGACMRLFAQRRPSAP
jgi:hypothetical protein